jgi:hypothetical protein
MGRVVDTRNVVWCDGESEVGFSGRERYLSRVRCQ